MSFDGIFLHKLSNELSILKTGRISKINELSDTNFLFTIRAQKENYNLFLGFNSDTSRVHLTNRNFEHTQSSKAFTLFLKKHLEGYFISDISQYETDRILIFTCEGYNEMKDRNLKYLICEIMGRYSNLIITDNNYTILESLHHDGVGEFNRIIMPNVKYSFPKTEKINPYKINKEELENLIKNGTLNSPKSFVNYFLGISYSFANQLFVNDDIVNNFFSLLYDKYQPSIFNNLNNKNDFYFFHNTPLSTYSSLSDLLDEIFYERDKKEQIRKETNDLMKFVERQIDKNKKKIDKLIEEKNLAMDCEDQKLYGELLLSAPNLKEKAKSILVFNYYNNKELNIKLDEKLTILENSQKYYKKYQKLKKSISFIDEQTKIANDEIEYFNLLKNQILNANLLDVIEIYDELVKNKYLMPKNSQNKKKKKPNITTYLIDDTIIYVGKNNIQNEYITHTLAKPQNLWFHVKDGSGSHVVIAKNDDYTEKEIRTAANIAAYYSYAKDSSSVAVDYTKVRYIKKIPGKRACFVSYTNQNTIYIDPNYELIKELKVKK